MNEHEIFLQQALVFGELASLILVIYFVILAYISRNDLSKHAGIILE